MSNTRTKLDEAKYFLTRMAEEVANREPFQYNLSAFLAAGRSVTCIMQKEFSKFVGFMQWYNSTLEVMNSDSLFKLMNKKRVMTIHQKPIRPRGHIDVTSKSTVSISEHVVEVLTCKDGTTKRIEGTPSTSPSPKESKTEIVYHWFFEDIPDKNIITLSQEYIAKLESLVKECEDKFTK